MRLAALVLPGLLLAACASPPDEPGPWHTWTDHFGDEAQAGKHRHAGRLQHDAGADRARIRGPLEERDLVAAAG